MSTKTISISLRTILILTLLSFITSHFIQEITAQQQQITAFLNQPLHITIPFQKCFLIQTEIDANKQFLDFKPTKIAAQAQKSYSLNKQGSKISVLEELRSPINYKHRHLLSFGGYLMVFFPPNVIIIVEQTSNAFIVKNRYQIQSLGFFDQFKMYKLGGQGMLVGYNKKTVYLLNQLAYQEYTLSDVLSITHLEQLNNLQFFAAQLLKGVTHYKLNEKDKRVEIIRSYYGSDIGLQQRLNYVVDLNLNFYEHEQIIYILDAQTGLLELNLRKKTAKVIVNHLMCQSFDMITRNHIVILCQNQGHSSIIEVYREENKLNKAFSYHKAQPLFQQTYLSDLHVTDTYFLAFSSKNIKIFWNIKKNKLPQTLEIQSHLVLPGLQTFTFIRRNSESFIYTIQAGELYKYVLIEKPASLQVKAKQAISKTFKISFYGSCADLKAIEYKSTTEDCKVSKTVRIRVVKDQYPRQEDLRMSSTIVAMLVIVFLLVIWICLKKYKSLQRQARKVLQAYQNKRLRQSRRL